MRNFNKTVHLEESELDLRFNKCPICASANSKKIGTIQIKPQVNAVVCRKCNLGYADRQPTSKAIDDYYANYYKTINRNTTIKKELLINHLCKHTIKDKELDLYNILDFGGGDGSISYGLAEHLLKTNSIEKINIYVIDPNFSTLENQNENIMIHNLPSIESISEHNKVDYVIASAILEHVKDPGKIITQLFDIMKPNATFYARTPYIFPFKKLFASFGVDLTMDYPGHLFDMGNKFWNSNLRTFNREDEFQILISRTSLVETNINENFWDWFLSHVFKLPSKFFKNHYHFVGGWEVFIMKKPNNKG